MALLSLFEVTLWLFVCDIQTDNEVLLGASWFHSFDNEEEYCKGDCDNPTPPDECTAAEQRAAEEACEVLTTVLKVKECDAKICFRDLPKGWAHNIIYFLYFIIKILMLLSVHV